MGKRFNDKTVFITGGSSGIGAATGVAFAREGADVVLAARNEDRLADAVEAVEAAGGQVLAVRCDVTERSSIDQAVAKAVDRFGGLDVVLANAGFGVDGPFQKLTTADFRRQFDTNVFGVIDTLYATLPHLLASQGRIGIVSSVLGKIARPTMSAYTASKFALCGLSEALYYELADQGVSVTGINPGLVESNFRRVDNTNRLRVDWTESAPEFLIVSADRAAREIVQALYKRRVDVQVTGHAKVAVFVYRHAPGLVRFAIRRATRGRMGARDRSWRESVSPDRD